MTIKIDPIATIRGRIIIERSDDDPSGVVITFDASPHVKIVQKNSHEQFLQLVHAMNQMALEIVGDHATALPAPLSLCDRDPPPPFEA